MLNAGLSIYVDVGIGEKIVASCYAVLSISLQCWLDSGLPRDEVGWFHMPKASSILATARTHARTHQRSMIFVPPYSSSFCGRTKRYVANKVVR